MFVVFADYACLYNMPIYNPPTPIPSLPPLLAYLPSSPSSCACISLASSSSMTVAREHGGAATTLDHDRPPMGSPGDSTLRPASILDMYKLTRINKLTPVAS